MKTKIVQTQQKEELAKKEVAKLKEEMKNYQKNAGGDQEQYFANKMKQANSEKESLTKTITKMREEKTGLECNIEESKGDIISFKELLEKEQAKIQAEALQITQKKSDLESKNQELRHFKEELQ